ncbi:nuclease SbcCD subunit C [Marmoricola endophyticus]|uniref:Nuclease SbcCD subunit C n=1 Tax=Marmoricola endophyticus TaxID=2040280 RepID=A0A917BDM7_9ACTN|nr:SMC family ATPase [Marmoricola endophyticus]GGF34803.1 nuclease SbcCD subunit C [Marmoricola endophyticus]
MRLHSLSLTAFGPFAGTTEVDFDDLGASGVFLLCGDTGAGKTTVLDAVCFALYGDLPSRRAKAKQLRSHFAADGVGPSVRLEASFAERRLRFTRSPAWQRPKRRGTGLTEEKAKVLVEELRDESWVAVAGRPDEAGLLVDDLLGMTKDQFDQVVLLPQGQFDSFLSASAEDRQQVLTKLFATHRFEAVQRWLVERRSVLRREGEAHASRVSALLHRLSEATGTAVPVELVERPDEAAASGSTSTWAHALQQAAVEQSEATQREHTAAGDALTSARTALDAARIHADLVRRHAAACAELDRLGAGEERAERDERRVADAARAAAVAVRAERAEAARRTADCAEREAVRVLSGVQASLPGDDEAGRQATADSAEEIGTRADEAARRATFAEALAPHVEELSDLRRELDRLDERITAADHELESLDARARTSAEDEARLDARVLALEATAAGIDEARTALHDVDRSLSRHARVAELEGLARTARDRLHAADEARAVARERRDDLRERRLLGMAAELACRVADGTGCPVCGSHDHPHLAVPAPGAPTEADERAAQVAADDAESAQQVAREELSGVESTLRGLAVEPGALGPLELAEQRRDLQQALDTATTAAADLVSARERLRASAEERSRHDRDLAAMRSSRSGLAEQRETAARRTDATAGRLRGMLGAEEVDEAAADADLATAVREFTDRQRQAADSLRLARTALERRDRERAAAASAEQEADAAAVDAGFADRAEAVAAVIPTERLEALRDELRTRADASAAARQVLADPDVRAALGGERPDLTRAEAAHDEAADLDAVSLTRATRARERERAVRAHVAALGAVLADWAPVRESLEVARAMAELAEGKGVQNHRAMSLSAYVLSARLSQVVAAANERLTLMSDSRYVLEHTAERSVGDRRGGLSLLVRDEWTDEVRDPVTLSGGETFVVSLALALGLADVVTAESGGTRIDTLFVDEGFGSLDPDTLELVMDSLDDLREGGRVVGVVSHVPELRSRIGTQLAVTKERDGSSVAVVHASA